MLLFLIKNVVPTLLLLFILLRRCSSEYEPTWESLDSRPLPQWYDDAKFGIFIHWGVYSVPAYKNEWFWYYLQNEDTNYTEYFENNYSPQFTYQDFARDFKAEFYDPEEWAELFQKAGAKYVIITSKHHEGYALWPTKYSYGWNSMDVGSHRDLIGDLATAVRNKTDLRFGVYHSLFEWFHPVYMEEEADNYSTNDFVTNKVLPQMMELVENYEPDIFWSDGDNGAPDTYWQSKEFLTWLYNESPVKDSVIVNDRWGQDTACQHGGVYNCQDDFDPGTVQTHKWESATTIYKPSWGYVRDSNLDDFLTTSELISLLARTVSAGGNLVLNIGPTKEGTISPIFQERLLQIGDWLSVNGEAIYETKPWSHQIDGEPDQGLSWYTSKEGIVYAIIVQWPENNVLNLNFASSLFQSNSTIVSLLGYSTPLTWEVFYQIVTINLPNRINVKSQWAWTLKITNYEE